MALIDRIRPRKPRRPDRKDMQLAFAAFQVQANEFELQMETYAPASAGRLPEGGAGDGDGDGSDAG